MAGTYDVFGSFILFKEVFSDDLGHLFRAGAIGDDAITRKIWLRVLNGHGLPADRIISSFEQARLIGDAMVGAQVPTEALYIDVAGAPVLGCDYVAGQPLNRVLERARDEAFPLQPDNTLLIVEKLALALSTAQSIEVSGGALTHGFLHPGLVYLSNDGETLVTGFGVGEALLAALETPDSVPGSRAYLAPEVLSEQKPSLAGDVYSLGAILFHLLTGTALPVEPEDRPAALEAALIAWDGEALAPDIRSILNRALAPAPDARFASATDFRTELDRLIYGGAYSPTTFNLALFMDRLFRAEIEADEIALEQESEIDLRSYVASEPEAVSTTEVLDRETSMVAPEAVSPEKSMGGRRVLLTVVGGAAIVAVIALVFWIGREVGPEQPPPPPTPTAEDIAARRQAQDDRLRALTQEMVQEMMAEREEEIRQELIARQSRIEELQIRLQKSERRAAQSAAAAATEAETQRALKQEIEAQEEAQRLQEDVLDAERLEAMTAASQQASTDVPDDGTLASADASANLVDGSSSEAERAVDTPPPIPAISTALPEPTIASAVSMVKPGDFVSPGDADTLPIVVKSQSLIWPRNAQRSQGKGVVVVQQTVNDRGGIDDVVILRADDTGWGIPEAALEAAKGYRYKPGTKNGVAITTHAFITWRYDFTQQ